MILWGGWVVISFPGAIAMYTRGWGSRLRVGLLYTQGLWPVTEVSEEDFGFKCINSACKGFECLSLSKGHPGPGRSGGVGRERV